MPIWLELLVLMLVAYAMLWREWKRLGGKTGYAPPEGEGLRGGEVGRERADG